MTNPDEVIGFLNHLLFFDRAAIEALVENRIPCNEALADHPSVQVCDLEQGSPKVGLLGILNGLCGTREDGWGFIAAVYEEGPTGENQLVRFERTAR
jgi:hypothetical protein